MSKELIDMLIEVAKTGGDTAVKLVLMIQLVSLAKTGIIMGGFITIALKFISAVKHANPSQASDEE